jgi:hypothetical protein
MASETKVIQEVKEYQYFQPELVEAIGIENIYEDDVEPPWGINEFVYSLLF